MAAKNLALIFATANLLATSTAALNPNCAPGGNFDLSKWQLQLPIGSQYNPQEVGPSQLEGCGGYQDDGHHYFFTETGDGAMVMKAPGDPAKTGCVTFKESKHCRTEFAEVNPSSWDTTASVNRLFVELIGKSGSNVCIGQAFQANNNLKPVAEVYYYNNGDIVVGVEKVATGGSQALTTVDNVPQGTKFTYQLSYEGGQLAISINGGAKHNLKTYFNTPKAFFKAGAYNQGDDEGDIHVFQLTATHEA